MDEIDFQEPKIETKRVITRNPKLRMLVLQRDDFTCRYCGCKGDSKSLGIDHIRPISAGGETALKNLVTACFKCNARKSNRHLAEVIEDSADHLIRFKASTETIRSIVETNGIAPYLKESLNCMLVSNLIAAMETYLSDYFISSVLNSDLLLRKFVCSNPDFGKLKFSLNEIFEKHDSIKDTAKEYLLNQIYHRLDKVKPMYESVFEISFPSEIDEVFRLIELRHDIVHRNGKNKDGDRVSFSDRDVLDSVNEIESFIFKLDALLPNK
jgi:hypothetical protein